MRFDKFDDSFEGGPVPDGTHTATIVKAKDWTSEDGSREALIITLRVEGFEDVVKFIEATDPRGHKEALKLGAALGLDPAAGLDPADLVGRELLITTKRGEKDGQPVFDKYGQRRVFVNGMAAVGTPAAPVVERAVAPPAAGNKPAAKRTPKQKADAAATSGTDDDIPFLWIVPLLTAMAAGGMA